MANDLTDSPLKIDTAATVLAGSFFIPRMVWQEPSAAGEDLIVNDSAGRTLWDENAYTGGTGISIEQVLNQICNGVVVHTIDSGTLFIYYRKKGGNY